MALFLSLAIGYWIGKLKFGKFQLGGVAGSLLVAVVVSQVGVTIDNGVKAVLFALFIYAVGFESGPQFFSSLGGSRSGRSCWRRCWRSPAWPRWSSWPGCAGSTRAWRPASRPAG